nr:hypothetical protein [Desulfobacula sp.]
MRNSIIIRIAVKASCLAAEPCRIKKVNRIQDMAGRNCTVFLGIQGIHEDEQKIKPAEKKKSGSAQSQKQEGMNQDESGKKKRDISKRV